MFKTNSNVVKFQILLVITAILLFLIKILAWYLTSSVSILTDALESIVNIFASLFTLYCLYFSQKPKDENHPYGHGKIEFIASIIEGSLILTTGVLMISKSIYNLFISSPLVKIELGLILIFITAIINLALGIQGSKIGKNNKSPALIASSEHLKIDSYSTFLIILVLFLLLFFNIPWLDPILAILLSFYIIYNGIKIIRPSLGGILDEADDKLLQTLVSHLQKNRSTNWVDFHNVRIIKFGGKLHLDCHLTLPWYFNLYEAHKEIDKLYVMVNELFNHRVEVFVHTDYCQKYACPICIKPDCEFRKLKFKKAKQWTVENVTRTRQHSIN